MAITFSCQCGKSVQVSDEFAGREGQCPSCRRAVPIPDPDGHFSEKPQSARKKTAPWDVTIPTVEPLPEPGDNIGWLVNHAGLPVSGRDDFFADAPPQIGRLYSAFSTLKRSQEPWSTPVRVLLALVSFLVGPIATLIGVYLFFGNALQLSETPIYLGVATLVGGQLAIASYLSTRFRHTCSYVGTKGIAVFRCSGDRDRVELSECFLFEDAAELRIHQTRHYYNRFYTGTQYSFVWTDDRGRTVHQLSGNYKSEEGNPHAADPYHFALMAENAWTMHLFRDIDRFLDGRERVFFGLKGGNYVELAKDLFILAQGGKVLELEADEIEKMTVGNGVVTVWEVGAKEGWFVNKGIHQFMYHDLGNARFFLFALERLLEIRF